MGEANEKRKSEWITPSLIVQIIVWIFMLAFGIGIVNAHMTDENVHMPYEKKVEKFLTRQEFDLYNASVKAQLDRIEDKVEILIKEK